MPLPPDGAAAAGNAPALAASAQRGGAGQELCQQEHLTAGNLLASHVRLPCNLRMCPACARVLGYNP